jgi:hypothetical protein
MAAVAPGRRIRAGRRGVPPGMIIVMESGIEHEELEYVQRTAQDVGIASTTWDFPEGRAVRLSRSATRSLADLFVSLEGVGGVLPLSRPFYRVRDPRPRLTRTEHLRGRARGRESTR